MGYCMQPREFESPTLRFCLPRGINKMRKCDSLKLLLRRVQYTFSGGEESPPFLFVSVIWEPLLAYGTSAASQIAE